MRALLLTALLLAGCTDPTALSTPPASGSEPEAPFEPSAEAAATPPIGQAQPAQVYRCAGDRGFIAEVLADGRLRVTFRDRPEQVLDPFGDGQTWTNGAARHEPGAVIAHLGQPSAYVRFGAAYVFNDCAPEAGEVEALDRVPDRPGLWFIALSREPVEGAQPVRYAGDGGVLWLTETLFAVEPAELVAATVEATEWGGWAVQVELGGEAALAFAEATRARLGEVLGVLVDGALVTAPVVHEPIRDGKIQITGSYSLSEAEQLASAIRGDS